MAETGGGGGDGAQRAQCCGNGQAAECGNRNSPSGPGYEWVKRFADDESTWLLAFQAAWTKATENGFTTLKSVCQGACTESPLLIPESMPAPTPRPMPERTPGMTRGSMLMATMTGSMPVPTTAPLSSLYESAPTTTPGPVESKTGG